MLLLSSCLCKVEKTALVEASGRVGLGLFVSDLTNLVGPPLAGVTDVTKDRNLNMFKLYCKWRESGIRCPDRKAKSHSYACHCIAGNA